MLILAKRGNIKWPPMNKCSPFLRFKSAAIVDGGFSIYASIAKLGILQCSSIWLSASPQKDRLRKRTLKCLKANQDWSSTVQDRDTEPPRVFRRQFILSQATLADSSSWR
jgi:hypothetical protein